jgi:hypothetical protein
VTEVTTLDGAREALVGLVPAEAEERLA